MKNATIYDVARESGLSIKTVSRVMNRDPAVKAANRDRILKAAETLDYSPSLSARSLAGARSFVIAAFLDAELTLAHWRNGHATDYLSRLQLGAIPECRKANYHFTLELIDHDPAKLNREVRSVLQTIKPDGILLTQPSCDDPHMLDLLEKSGVRYARLGSNSDLPGGMQLHLGDRSGAAEVTRHLLSLEHRRIAIVAGPFGASSSRERVEGFREAMAAAGLTVNEDWVREGDFTFHSALKAMNALMASDPRPTAVFACSDEMAVGCLAALTELGLTCPDDVSIAGFDDSVAGRTIRPQLTTVRQPLVSAVADATRRLIDATAYQVGFIESGEPCSLIVGGSTSPLHPCVV